MEADLSKSSVPHSSRLQAPRTKRLLQKSQPNLSTTTINVEARTILFPSKPPVAATAGRSTAKPPHSSAQGFNVKKNHMPQPKISNKENLPPDNKRRTEPISEAYLQSEWEALQRDLEEAMLKVLTAEEEERQLQVCVANKLAEAHTYENILMAQLKSVAASRKQCLRKIRTLKKELSEQNAAFALQKAQVQIRLEEVEHIRRLTDTASKRASESTPIAAKLCIEAAVSFLFAMYVLGHSHLDRLQKVTANAMETQRAYLKDLQKLASLTAQLHFLQNPRQSRFVHYARCWIHGQAPRSTIKLQLEHIDPMSNKEDASDTPAVSDSILVWSSMQSQSDTHLLKQVISWKPSSREKSQEVQGREPTQSKELTFDRVLRIECPIADDDDDASATPLEGNEFVGRRVQPGARHSKHQSIAVESSMQFQVCHEGSAFVEEFLKPSNYQPALLILVNIRAEEQHAATVFGSAAYTGQIVRVEEAFLGVDWPESSCAFCQVTQEPVHTKPTDQTVPPPESVNRFEEGNLEGNLSSEIQQFQPEPQPTFPGLLHGVVETAFERFGGPFSTNKSEFLYGYIINDHISSTRNRQRRKSISFPDLLALDPAAATDPATSPAPARRSILLEDRVRDLLKDVHDLPGMRLGGSKENPQSHGIDDLLDEGILPSPAVNRLTSMPEGSLTRKNLTKRHSIESDANDCNIEGSEAQERRQYIPSSSPLSLIVADDPNAVVESIERSFGEYQGANATNLIVIAAKEEGEQSSKSLSVQNAIASSVCEADATVKLKVKKYVPGWCEYIISAPTSEANITAKSFRRRHRFFFQGWFICRSPTILLVDLNLNSNDANNVMRALVSAKSEGMTDAVTGALRYYITTYKNEYAGAIFTNLWFPTQSTASLERIRRALQVLREAAE